jgi:predicted NUDIX family NTP pyrophosphohydrolase
MPTLSAGLLLYRRTAAGLEVLIAHMGGPFWAGKDERAWSIPKGEYLIGEDPLEVARREFEEELGMAAPDVAYRLLGEFRQRSGKVVTVFAAEADLAVDAVTSNTFPLEWPPRSGRIVEFPEVDDARWVSVEVARVKLVVGQVPALDRLENPADSAGE